jgi:hypothetical protein
MTNCTITLDVVKRQGGEDAEFQGFRRTLDNLRVNKVTHQDWTLLSTRVRSKLEAAEDLSRFDDVLRIYAYKDDSKAYNHFRLRELKRPMLMVSATHTGRRPAENASTDEAGNLHSKMLVSINARIMLRENLCVERCLFNGSIRIIRDII